MYNSYAIVNAYVRTRKQLRLEVLYEMLGILKVETEN